jgi:hypothetical protein
LNKKPILQWTGIGILAVGLVIYLIPVPTTFGQGCGPYGCAVYEHFDVPSIALGSLTVIVGLILSAYAFGIESEDGD